MTRFSSDAIDDCCKEIRGHDNWGYADVTVFTELYEQIIKGNVVIFYDEPIEEGD